MIPYSRQYIDEDDIKEVIKVLKSDYITQGPKILEFEKALSTYTGSKYCVVYNSGTSALHASYYALGLSKSDEFITSPMTFCATVNAGLYIGLKPVFVDIEEDTGNIDTGKIEENITEKTKLIVPIHYAGHPVDLEKIRYIADKYNLKVIEDACHALGARYKNAKIGNCKYSDITVFSFHPVKHITTGEGGAALTNNDEYYDILLKFRDHGINRKNFINKPDGDWYYEMQSLGYNYRMTDIQAALGLTQLKKIDMFIEKRRKHAAFYNNIFADNLFFDLPVEKSYATHSYHLYPVRLNDQYANIKSTIFRKLRNNGIGVQVHYIPVYLHPYYRNIGFKQGLSMVAENFYNKTLSLPIYPSMDDETQKYLIDKLFNIFKNI